MSVKQSGQRWDGDMYTKHNSKCYNRETVCTQRLREEKGHCHWSERKEGFMEETDEPRLRE